jgi:hypothetical protein
MFPISSSKPIHRERLEPEGRRDLPVRTHGPLGQLHHREPPTGDVALVEAHPRHAIDEHHDDPFDGIDLAATVDVHDATLVILGIVRKPIIT